LKVISLLLPNGPAVLGQRRLWYCIHSYDV